MHFYKTIYNNSQKFEYTQKCTYTYYSFWLSSRVGVYYLSQKQVRHKVEPSYNLKEDDEQFEPTTRKYLLGPLYEDWRYLKELLLDEGQRF